MQCVASQLEIKGCSCFITYTSTMPFWVHSCIWCKHTVVWDELKPLLYLFISFSLVPGEIRELKRQLEIKNGNYESFCFLLGVQCMWWYYLLAEYLIWFIKNALKPNNCCKIYKTMYGLVTSTMCAPLKLYWICWLMEELFQAQIFMEIGILLMNLPSANTTDILFVHSLLVKCGTCKRQLAELKTVMTCKS